MAGSMSLADLVADLKESLSDSVNVLAGEDDAAFARFLRQALPDMRFKRPLTRLGQATLQADEPVYAIGYADFAALKTDLWRDTTKLPKPWAPSYPGALPRICAERGATGWELRFDPAPTVAHLSVLGTVCRYWYFADHQIGADAGETTVAPADRGLLLLRAQAEAMLALAVHSAGKPVVLRDGLSGTPRNSTPAALHHVLLDLFREAR